VAVNKSDPKQLFWRGSAFCWITSREAREKFISVHSELQKHRALREFFFKYMLRSQSTARSAKRNLKQRDYFLKV
jgi:hypothetical protein